MKKNIPFPLKLIRPEVDSREYKKIFSWNPSKSLIASFRAYHGATSSIPFVNFTVKSWALICHRFWSVVCGVDIPISVKFGRGILMPHTNGIVIHGNSVIGENCLIFHQVTIGTRNSEPPIIGNNVDIGAGAKILGSIKIGDHANIGANAVVITDVPAYATAVGIPAKIILKKSLKTN